MPISFDQILSFVPDLILIFISGTACLYCYLLNRRLTKLNNLDTGLGATIVTLTKAIEGTYNAAQSAQVSTKEAVEKLNGLLERSDKVLPESELLVKALERSYERARDRQELLEYSIEVSLERAVSKAETTAADLLKIVAEIKAKERARKLASSEEKSSLSPSSNIQPMTRNSAT